MTSVSWSLELILDVFGDFLIVERLKYRENSDVFANQYFWRTYDKGEIDLVE